jgi:alkylresorcinol/alkylpyrone synthase
VVTAHLVAVGSAFPQPLDQEELWQGYFHRHFGCSPVARRIFHTAGVRRRHGVVSPLTEDIAGWTTERRMRRYAEEAEPLGRHAVAEALATANVAAEDVGLLTVASCTGYTTPGLDIQIAADLDMGADVQRLLVGHMGCYAALPGLRAASDFVATHRRPAVLACVELTTLHLQPPTSDVQQIVAHALFGDAAAAVVLHPEPLRPAGSPPALRMVDVLARTAPGSVDDMAWEVTDHGFRMRLSARVPYVLARHLRPALDELLTRHGLTVRDVAAWAVHPGGPKILDTVRRECDLPAEALGPSREVLTEHGNCSSPTVLLVLERLRAQGAVPRGGYAVALAFGPGLTLYAALLRAG